MKVVCGWCWALIQDGPAKPISHGMCPTCLERWHAEMDALEAAK